MGGALARLLLYVLYVAVAVVVVINPKTVPQTSYLTNIDVRERHAKRSGINVYYTYYLSDRNYMFTRRAWLTGLPSFTSSEYKQFRSQKLPLTVSYYIIIHAQKPLYDDRITTGPFGLQPGATPAKNAWYWVSLIKHVTGNTYAILCLLACLFASIAAYGFNENSPSPSRKPLLLLIVNFIVFFGVFIYFFI